MKTLALLSCLILGLAGQARAAGQGGSGAGNWIGNQNSLQVGATAYPECFYVGSPPVISICNGVATIVGANVSGGSIGASVSIASTAVNAALPATVTLQGNSFNGANQLLQLNASSQVPNNLLDSSSVTKQGNTFNGNSQLVQLTAAGKYPALDGSLITNLPTAAAPLTLTGDDGNGIVLTEVATTPAAGLISYFKMADASGNVQLVASSMPLAVLLANSGANNSAGGTMIGWGLVGGVGDTFLKGGMGGFTVHISTYGIGIGTAADPQYGMTVSGETKIGSGGSISVDNNVKATNYLYSTRNGAGLCLKSPNGTSYVCGPDNSGVFTCTGGACP